MAGYRQPGRTPAASVRVRRALEALDRKVDEGATVDTVTTTASLTIDNEVVLVDASSGAVVLSVFAAADGYRPLTFKKTDTSANTVTIDGDGAETIDGDPNYVLSERLESITIVSDLSNWWVVAWVDGVSITLTDLAIDGTDLAIDGTDLGIDQ